MALPRLPDRADEKLDGIESARTAVSELIDHEIRSSGIDPSKARDWCPYGITYCLNHGYIFTWPAVGYA